jgi:hypothetical protein
MSPGYAHLPTSAFSPVLAAERQMLIKEESEQKFDSRVLQGKENQAMDLSSKPNQSLFHKSMSEQMTQSKEDSSWRPW